ncbi:Peroxisomal membrane protein LPX1 [Hypsizygus marmoreus]|uniref:Peroxisomal membrane protein LPX1 n=1 Tax=Hypsizygus marmoreus TaxID=39966 RepID=A0A369JSU8_HYPMA|nr:Peroxisomal membrane protein LPX1 [Hypsizygus marmoreus]
MAQLPSYSQPPPYTWPTVPTRTLLPVFPPPEPLTKPPLPSPPRKPAFDAPYTLSTHLFPAAYLRTTELVPVPPPPPDSATRAERQAIARKTMQELKDLRGSTVPRGTKQVLWNCANRYVRNGLDGANANGLTLFFAHANGFPKEIWEPVLSHLLASPAGAAIDEVWTWESVQHGDACLINADKLGGVFDWSDNARDILNFLLHYLPSKVSSSTLPTHLVRLPAQETEYRKTNPFKHRTFVAVGHSYGGCTSTLAALTHPALFSSIFLIDPVIVKPPFPDVAIPASQRVDQLVLGALTRRDTWSSTDEALALFVKSPFFGAWDPAVLRVYIECGTFTTRDPVTNAQVVKLKMPGIQEAVVFSETHTEYEVFHQLPGLDERIELRWIVPGREGAGEFGPPGSTRERVWVRPKNASNVRIPGAGHLIPQEAPQLLAQDIAQFIERKYGPMRPGARANL